MEQEIEMQTRIENFIVPSIQGGIDKNIAAAALVKALKEKNSQYQKFNLW